LNGTTVNAAPAENARLRHGDRIHVGDFVFAFLESDEADLPSLSSSVIFNDINFNFTKTVRLSFDEIVGAMARDFVALMKISTKINSVRNFENLQKTLLEQLFEVVPARQSAILLIDKDGEITDVFGLDRDGADKNVSVSRTIVNQVISEKNAILANDLAGDENLNRAESLVVSKTASLLCVPLILFEEITGALYLCADKTDTHFDESHLRFATAVAGIAAVAIENVRNIEFLERENARLREETLLERNMLGESPAIQKIFGFIGKVAPTDSTVLINGESGTGKELAAQAIHLNSNRRDKPFVAINCAALNENLLESELFGHERGAFTGAVAQKRGKIELAQSGTLFLDEIGEMAVSLQAKLLRVLQEREFERVGGAKPLKADIRLIAATNRNLETEVKNGTFRQDLFYRLNVVRFTMPPLRERKEDVLMLAESFVRKFALKSNRRLRGISARAKKILLDYDFPGNVRELENAVERAVVLGSGEWILPEDLPENLVESADLKDVGAENITADSLNYQQVIQEKKKQLIRSAFTKARGSYVEAAKLLDVHPNYLHRLIRNLDIKEELEKTER
jgi:Nif-specific regulatory protein